MEGFWSGVDKLSYWVLFPALLFNKTSQIDFTNPMLPKLCVYSFVCVDGDGFVCVHYHLVDEGGCINGIVYVASRGCALILLSCWRWAGSVVWKRWLGVSGFGGVGADSCCECVSGCGLWC